MNERIKGFLKMGAVAVIAMAIGAGAVFAMTQPGSNVTPDSVVVLKTLGMTCGSCAGKIEAALKAKPGVAEVMVDVDAAQVRIAYDAKVISPEVLAETVTTAGFRSGIVQNLSTEEYRKLTGQDLSTKKPAKKSGCGGSCC
jgi:copper chaperone CopZ